jgi:signal transduction histidine kinase
MAESSVVQQLRVFAYTGLFCLAIGSGLTLLADGASLWGNLAVSFAIGWSINLAFVLFEGLFPTSVSPYIKPIPLTAVGLAVGLIIGGYAVSGNPWLFFGNDYSTLALGVFFGVVGFIIFSTRGRLLATQADLAKSIAARERQEKLIAETELKLLQAQIEPHFLFNTLSNIHGLITKNPNVAEATLLNLTKLLRSSLNRTRKSQTTLSEELEIAKAYLDIHAIRMQGRLRYSIEHDPTLDNCLLPPLLVQPLIENAIKHGIDPLENGGAIEIKTGRVNGQLQIAVTDTGSGITDKSGNGTGLSNVKSRLHALYRDRAELVLEDNLPQGVRARLRLPFDEVHR